MSIVIPAANQPFVHDLIASGHFSNEAEVVAAALTQMEQARKRDDSLRAQLLPALERLDRGEGVTVDREGLLALRDQIKGGSAS